MLSRSEVRHRLWQSFIKSAFNLKVIVGFILCVLLVISAFSVVVVKYHYKVVLDEVQKSDIEREDLRDAWTQILIEYSTLASPSHVEAVARQNHMHFPTPKEIKTIRTTS